MNQPEILIIGVIYNTYPETLRYLESIAAPANGSITLILVDNSIMAAPGDFKEKIRQYSFLHYITTGKNLGYFGGARAGLKHYLSEHDRYPQWILVTNVDICFSPGFFDRLVRENAPENLGIIAPSIVSQKWNTDYNPKITNRYTIRKVRFYQYLYLNFMIQNVFFLGAYLKKWISGKRKQKNNQNVEKRKIYAPHGSCMVFNKSYFKKGGTLDLPNFLFGEEIFVAEACLRSGLDVVYDPGFIIYDHEHASVGFFVSPKMNRYYRESIKTIMRLFYQVKKVNDTSGRKL
jgi:GT2 family glycosyltransferase